jgi:hypothetical protein
MHNDESRWRLPQAAVTPAPLSVLSQGAAQAPSLVVLDADMGTTAYLPTLSAKGKHSNVNA